MGKQRLFWGLVLRQAGADFWRQLVSARDHLMWSLIQVAVVFLVLYYVPGLGDLRGHVNEAVLLALAILATGVLQLLASLMMAPARVYAITGARVNQLTAQLGGEADWEAIRAEIVALYWEGREFFENESDYAVWKGDRPRDWINRARAAVERHYDSSLLFMFDTSTHEGSIRKTVGIRNYPPNTDDLRDIFSEMRAKLSSLDSLLHYEPRGVRLRREEREARAPS